MEEKWEKLAKALAEHQFDAEVTGCTCGEMYYPKYYSVEVNMEQQAQHQLKQLWDMDLLEMKGRE